MGKSSSSLSLKLQPVQLTDDFIQTKLDTMMTYRPTDRNRTLMPTASYKAPQTNVMTKPL